MHRQPVITLRAAAKLLAQADSLTTLRPVAHAIGFTLPARAVPADTLRTIGIRDLVSSAEIVRGDGALRLLCASLAPHANSPTTTHGRELLRRVCIALARHAPAQRWCILALDDNAQTLNLAAITAHPAGPRIATLRVDRTHIVDSDAETLRALCAVTDSNDQLRHARFTDILKRDALSTRFYHALHHTVTTLATTASGTASRAERLELALLCTSRFLFLAFLEAKGWLNANRNFLLEHTTTTLEHNGHLDQKFLRPLFFGTLNTPRNQRAPTARAFGDIPFLNGGLFAPTALERKRHTLRFSDDAITALVGDLLDRYRFTAHEDSTTFSEAAVDPEMLGRAFECLMAHDDRRRSGSFYTPPSLVTQVVHDALHSALPDLPANALTDLFSPLHLDAQTHAQLLNLRILDPACGSGAFLVHTLESLANIAQRSGDTQPLHTIRRATLTRTIFGVDRNPVAVWLCELRLWLSVVIECPETRVAHIPPLPNLDHHIRVGDSLAGGNFLSAAPNARKLSTLRDRYTRASGKRKHTVAAALDREERLRAIADTTLRLNALTHQRCTILDALRTPDLFGQRPQRTRQDTRQLFELRTKSRDTARHRTQLQLGAALPFRFATFFADIAANGGFQLVIGNPPWVRPHALPIAERLRLRTDFITMRNAAWRAGAKRAGATTGFAAQADIAAAFVERTTQLLAPGGTMALLVPAKLWRALAGGGLRQYLSEHTRIEIVRDWSDAPPLFDAATYPSLIVAKRVADRPVTDHPSALLPLRTHHPVAPTPQTRTPSTHTIHVAVARGSHTHSFTTAPHQLALAPDPGAPWVLLPHNAREAFERLKRAGPALGDSPIGRPTLGVKCGFNAAFLVHATEHDDDTATIVAGERTGVIERHILRPALRGDGIRDPDPDARHSPRRARIPNEDALRILWTHGPDGAPMRTLPPLAARWLAHSRRQLETRRDARSRTPWWTLFRTDAARCDTPRLVWADIGKRLRTRVLPAGDPTVPLNSCYILRTAAEDDAWALSALLASPLCRTWLDCLAEPARGGFRRYLGWTVASLPLPPNWISARNELATLGKQLATTRDVTPEHHTHVTADAYGIPMSSLQPLLDWDSP